MYINFTFLLKITNIFNYILNVKYFYLKNNNFKFYFKNNFKFIFEVILIFSSK